MIRKYREGEKVYIETGGRVPRADTKEGIVTGVVGGRFMNSRRVYVPDLDKEYVIENAYLYSPDELAEGETQHRISLHRTRAEEIKPRLSEILREEGWVGTPRDSRDSEWRDPYLRPRVGFGRRGGGFFMDTETAEKLREKGLNLEVIPRESEYPESLDVYERAHREYRVLPSE